MQRRQERVWAECQCHPTRGVGARGVAAARLRAGAPSVAPARRRLRALAGLPLLVLALAGLACQASGAEEAPTRRILPEEINGGVVVDQTVTVIGHDFYSHFALAWSEQPMSERYTLAVHERPTARWGSEVWVDYAQRRVFHAFLRPSRADLKRIAEQAAQAAYQRVVDAEVKRLLFREADLGWDEF